MKRRMKKAKLAILALPVVVLCALPGCGSKEETDLNSPNTTIAVEPTTIMETAAQTAYPDADYIYVNSLSNGLLAVTSGQADAYACDRTGFESALDAGTEGVAMHPDGVLDTLGEIAVGISPETQIPDAKGLIDSFLNEIKEDGTLEDLENRWITEADYTMPEIEEASDPDFTIRVGTTGLAEPYSFYVGEELVGADIEIAKRFALWCNAALEIEVYDWEGLIPACSTGKVDYILSDLIATDERREAIDFSEPYRTIYTVMVIPDTESSAATTASLARFSTLDDFSGTTLAVHTASVFDSLISEVIPDVTYKTYQDQAGEISALNKGDVDGIALDKPVAALMTAEHPEFAMFPEVVVEDNYGFALQKGSPYTEEFSEIIEEFYEDGTIDALQEKWFSGDEETMTIDWSAYDTEDRPNGTLRCVCDATQVPMTYIGDNGEVCGYEPELLLLIADRLDMGVSMEVADLNSLVNFLETDKADVASGCLSITPEREEAVDFPVSHYEGGVTIVCRAEDIAGATTEEEDEGFWQGVANSFQKTFVRENRWKLILSGLGVTLAITALAGVFGTILGFLLCLVLRAKNKVASTIAWLFCRLIEGIPAVVILMIIYFVIFAASNISAVAIGALSFTIIFMVTVAGTLNVGIDAVDPGQAEAASALGFSKVQGFSRVVFPQAIRHAMPAYKGELVAMLKMTSVVGYISIQDLTKAGDIIRSRTYEAFFPLITTAVIYLVLAIVINVVVGRIEKRIDPFRKKRRLPKGVTELPARDAAGAVSSGIPGAASGGNAVTASGASPEAAASDSMPPGEMICIRHLEKVYPNATPLRDVNADIGGGDVITIIGPSGTGKSTLLRCINRLETPTAGEIDVFGENVCDKNTDLNQIRRRMGMVFQSFYLFGHLNVVENIMLAPTRLNKQEKQDA